MSDDISTLAVVAYGLAGCGLAVALYRCRELAFRGIPDLSATAMGLFRIAFGVALYRGMSHFLALPDTPAPGGVPGEADLWAPWGWVEYLTTHADTRDALGLLTLVAIVAFTIGLGTRIAYALVVAGFVVRLLVAQEYGAVSHAWVIFPLVLLPMMVVPWGDGLSVDNLIRRRQHRRRPERPAGPHYGIAIWLPGFTLGCAWLAAAGAKIGASGLGWITDGAVRYHWAEDHLNAPSSLGAWVAGHETVAVLCSGVGWAVEALFITHVLFRSQRVRLAYGLAALALFSGFYLFQGVFWYAWWVILLAFLPWEAIANRGRQLVLRLRARRDDRPTPPALDRRESLGRLAPGAAVMVGLLLTQQLAVSQANVEQMPFVSNYPMYARTWSSPEEFNRVLAPTKFYSYELQGRTGQSGLRDLTVELDRANVGSTLRDTAAWVIEHPRSRRLHRALTAKLARVPEGYARYFRENLEAVVIGGRRRIFDFGTGKLRADGRIDPISVRFDPLEIRRLRAP